MSNAIAEVTKVVHAFEECWNQHDMNAFAELFAPDAEFVNVVGLWWKGRDEIKKAHEFTHATMFKNSRLTIADISVRFPLENLAIARSRWSLEGHVSPEGTPLPARNGILLNLLSSHSCGMVDRRLTEHRHHRGSTISPSMKCEGCWEPSGDVQPLHRADSFRQASLASSCAHVERWASSSCVAFT